MGDTVFVLHIHCTEVYDNKIYTKVLRVSESEYRPSIEYFRRLIERELDIPRVCQLSLSVAGVPMDPLETMQEFCLSDRVFKNPNPIALQYYTTSLNLKELSDIMEQSNNNYLKNCTIKGFYREIQTLTRFVRQVSWISKKVVGTTLFLVRNGYIKKLKSMLIFFNSKLESLLDQNKRIDSTVQLRCVMRCLSSILNFLWGLGGSWEFLLYLSELGLVDEFLRTFSIANNTFVNKSMPEKSIILNHNCYGIFQIIIELKRYSLRLGTNQQFLLLLKEICKYENFSIWQPIDFCLVSVIMFSISYHTIPSTQLANTGVYTEFLNYFMNDADCHITNDGIKSHYYNVGMMILNALRTPNIICFCCDFLQVASRFIHTFLQNVSINDIVQYEDDHCVVWEVMECFVAFFFIPSNSILGRIITEERSDEIVDRYYRMAFFVLEVLLRQERHRNKIIAEDLIDLLIVAHWRTHESTSIYNMLKIYFPYLVYYPVPSLHDIAAVSAFCAGLGDFSDLICS